MSTRTLKQQIFAPRCPQCGKGKLFAHMLKIADSCSVCGLDLTKFNPADGPTFFAITLVGFAIMGGATWVEIAYEPPMWVHAALWLPLSFIASIVVLRAFKSLLVTLEYRLLQQHKEQPNEIPPT